MGWNHNWNNPATRVSSAKGAKVDVACNFHSRFLNLTFGYEDDGVPDSHHERDVKNKTNHPLLDRALIELRCPRKEDCGDEPKCSQKTDDKPRHLQ